VTSAAEVAGSDLAEHLPAPDEGDPGPGPGQRRTVASPIPEVTPQTRIALPARLCSTMASHPGHGESQVGDARRIHYLKERQRHAAGQAMEVRGPAAEPHSLGMEADLATQPTLAAGEGVTAGEHLHLETAAALPDHPTSGPLDVVPLGAEEGHRNDIQPSKARTAGL
jgi:hypothetical protein